MEGDEEEVKNNREEKERGRGEKRGNVGRSKERRSRETERTKRRKKGREWEERMVLFDINSRVIYTVIVFEPHLRRLTAPFVYPTCSLGFVYPLFMTSSGNAQWTLKNQFPEQFSNSHPTEMLSIKISYNHSSGISRVKGKKRKSNNIVGSSALSGIASFGCDRKKKVLLPHHSICWRTGKADGETLVCSVCLCETGRHKGQFTDYRRNGTKPHYSTFVTRFEK